MKKLCSLLEAIQLCGADNGMRKGDNGEIVFTSNNISVDVLGVVVQVFPGRMTQNPSIDVWIADDSISSLKDTETILVVSLYGQRTTTQISVGNVVRFNNISLKRKLVKKSNNEDKSSVTFIFQHSWSEKEPGPDCFQMLPDAATATTAENGKSILQTTSLLNNCVVPENMETDPMNIQELIRWYQSSDFFRKRRESRLATLSCQKRSLEEIQASLGMISNVMARVTALETITEKASWKNVLKKRKRNSLPPRTVSIATICDKRQSQLPFLVLENRFQATLDEALATGKLVLFNNVVSLTGRRVSSWLADQQHWGDEVVLVPTDATNIVLLSAEEADVHNMNNDSELQQQTQPFLTATQSQYQNQNQLPASTSTSKEDHFIVESQLHDIIIDKLDNKSLAKEMRYWKTPEELGSILINKDDASFRGATLVIGDGGSDGDTLRVQAGPQVMQNLCGGVDTQELLRQPKSQRTVAELVLGFLEDEVILRWRLQKEDNGALKLCKVTLIGL